MAAELTAEGPAALDDGVLGRWRALAELRENPFLTPEWCTAWLDAHPEERPFLMLWYRDGELRGVLPLVAVAAGPLRVLRFAGARRGDWFTPACRIGEEREMALECAELLGRSGPPGSFFDSTESIATAPGHRHCGVRMRPA